MHIIKRSKIHGRGLFATRPIPKGTYIGTYEGPRAKRNGAYVLWLEDEDGSEHGISGRNSLRFVNHSRQPNAEFVGPDLFAVDHILEGHEITCHYGPDWDS